MKTTLMLAAALAASATFADKLYLKSGSFLTGEVAGASRTELTFKSDDLGELKIPVEKIAKLENAGNHVVRYNDDRRESKDLRVSDGAWYAGTAALEMGDVKEIDPAEEKWHGSIHGSFLASRGNTVENTWSLMADVNRRWENDRFKANFGYYFSEKGTASTEKEKSTDRWEAEAQHDHFWLPAFYTYENGRYDRDTIQLLNARYRLGLGVGYQWLENRVFEATGKWSFNQELGVNWIKEEYKNMDDSKSDGFAALRYAHHLLYAPKWNEGVQVFHNLEYLPDVDDFDKYLVKADVGLTTKLIYDFDLLAKIEWDFNSMPANGRQKSDLRYIIGLGYQW